MSTLPNIINKIQKQNGKNCNIKTDNYEENISIYNILDFRGEIRLCQNERLIIYLSTVLPPLKIFLEKKSS